MADRLCLIVEDEPAIQAYLRAVLESEHLQVLEAATASQALKIIERLAGRLDLIVSDVKMPGDIDGVDLAYSVHNLFPSVPIILISGFPEEQSRAITNVIFEFIYKPFTPEMISKAARRALAPGN